MLMMQGKLNKHLNRVDREAYERVKVLVMQMAEKEKVTERLKAEQSMLWVQRMNEIRNIAEEIALAEMIYV